MNRFVNLKYTKHPPTLDISKKGTPAELPAVNNNESQKVQKTTEIENHEPRFYQEFQKIPNLTLPKLLSNLPKTTKKLIQKKQKNL